MNLAGNFTKEDILNRSREYMKKMLLVQFGSAFTVIVEIGLTTPHSITIFWPHFQGPSM